MVPHGDRIDAAESGGVEHEGEGVRRGNDHVVGVLVLHDDLDDVPVAHEAVAQHLLEGRELRRVGDERGTLGGDLRGGAQLAGHPCSMPPGGCATIPNVRRAGLIALGVAFGVVGCVRDPADGFCPPLGEGGLVVTEIGGPQTGFDTLKPWIELYNASGASVDLMGVKIRFRRPSGSSETDTIVRRSLTVAAGDYVVLGLDDDLQLASYIDYGIAGDFHASWPSAAAVDVEVCDLRIDRVEYSSLPRTGTYSLGTRPPTAAANDLPAMWCTDTTVNTASFPGTPQKANKACP